MATRHTRQHGSFLVLGPIALEPSFSETSWCETWLHHLLAVWSSIMTWASVSHLWKGSDSSYLIKVLWGFGTITHVYSTLLGTKNCNKSLEGSVRECLTQIGYMPSCWTKMNHQHDVIICSIQTSCFSRKRCIGLILVKKTGDTCTFLPSSSFIPQTFVTQTILAPVCSPASLCSKTVFRRLLFLLFILQFKNLPELIPPYFFSP